MCVCLKEVRIRRHIYVAGFKSQNYTQIEDTKRCYHTKGNQTLETNEKCLFKLSDLRVRILEIIRKMKVAVCGGSIRTKWRMGN